MPPIILSLIDLSTYCLIGWLIHSFMCSFPSKCADSKTVLGVDGKWVVGLWTEVGVRAPVASGAWPRGQGRCSPGPIPSLLGASASPSPGGWRDSTDPGGPNPPGAARAPFGTFSPRLQGCRTNTGLGESGRTPRGLGHSGHPAPKFLPLTAGLGN